MSIRSLFNKYNNKKNKNNLTQKQEFEDTLNEYLYHSIFKKKSAKEILNNIDVYPYKDDVIYLLENISIFLNNRELYSEEILDKLIQAELSEQSYIDIFNKLNTKQRKTFLNLCIINMVNINYNKLQLRLDERKIIKNYLDEILTYYHDIFSLEKLFYNDQESLNKIYNYIDNNSNVIINNMLDPLYTNKESREQSKTYIKMIVDDIIKNEKANYSSIRRLNAGAFSCVYSIKDKVIKLGDNGRITYEFPNNPYIVKPLLRKTFELDDKNIFVEVTQKVDSDERKITKEDLYNLYSKLRDLKIRWTDVHTRNVGVLLKDNKIYWHNDLKPTDESLGLQKYRKARELKAGDFVVLDADFMYDENDEKIKIAEHSFDREFEIRYQRERKLKK